MKPNYNRTKIACYFGFITQAISANFAPLLFLTFHKDYGIPLGQIALISTTFFFTQLIVDFLCTKLADRIGYRICIVTSEITSALGLIGLAVLPGLLPNPFTGILISDDMTKEERAAEFVKQVKNPYCFRVGDMVVKNVYSSDGISLKDRFEQFARTL